MIRYIDLTERHADGTHTRYQHYNEDDVFLVTQQNANYQTTDAYEVAAPDFYQRVKQAMFRAEMECFA